MSREQAIRDYLATTTTPKLQLGAGPSILGGWLNTDLEPKHPAILPLDAREPLPFPDQSFAYLFGEHVIEHITYDQGRALLAECFRVLRPGGRLRFATPDLARMLALFQVDKTEQQKGYLLWATQMWMPTAPVVHPTLVLNNMMHNWGHQFVYTADVLAFSLQQAGFADMISCPLGQSPDPALCGLEVHGKVIGEAPNSFETMVIEARRP